jgi:hypothetical protein
LLDARQRKTGLFAIAIPGQQITYTSDSPANLINTFDSAMNPRYLHTACACDKQKLGALGCQTRQA